MDDRTGIPRTAKTSVTRLQLLYSWSHSSLNEVTAGNIATADNSVQLTRDEIFAE